jgi:LemA protein
MNRWAIWAGGLAVLALIASEICVRQRNEMVRTNEQMKQTWSEVDVQLQRRADLIPNLVATVKGYARHEEEVFHDAAAARAALLKARTPADRMAANAQLDGALGRLLAISENYPQLKANENFLELQDELEGTENRIAVARLRYNLSLRDYNAYISLFPNNLVARWSGFQRNNAYFAAAPGAAQPPPVNLQFPPGHWRRGVIGSYDLPTNIHSQLLKSYSFL